MSDDAPSSALTLLSLIYGDDGGTVVNPDTGEIITLADADLVDLVAARAALTDLDARRKTAVAMLDDEIVKRTDEQVRAGRLAGHTFTAGDYKVSVDATSPQRLNGSGLRADLMRRAAERSIKPEPDAIAHAFRTSYSLDRHRWKTLLKLDPTLQAVYDDHATATRRTTTVTRYRAAIDATSIDDPPELENPTW